MAVNKIEKLVDKQKSMEKFYESSNSLTNLAISEILLAVNYGYFSEKGQFLLKSAENNLQKSLIKSPANSASWFRLAYIKFILEGQSQNVADYLYMSVITMPYDYKIIKPRLVLSEMVQDFLSDEQMEAINNQKAILENR